MFIGRLFTISVMILAFPVLSHAESCEENARIKTLESNPEVMCRALQARSCSASAEKKVSLKSIKDHYAFAKRTGGIIDKVEIFDYQRNIKAMEMIISFDAQRSKELKCKPISCASVAVLIWCMANPNGEGCDQYADQLTVKTMPDHLPNVDGVDWSYQVNCPD